MILNFSVNPKEIINFTTKYIDLYNFKFPLICIDKDSYIVSSTIESGVDLSNDRVHNIQIGKFCSIAHNVSFIVDLNHDYNNLSSGYSELFGDKLYTAKRKGQILIQNDVWIGRGTSIMSGVTIHNGAIIAANSHVIKDVAPYAIVGGNPAKVIKYRFSDEIIQKLLSISWWDWDEQKIKDNSSYFSNKTKEFCDKYAPILDNKKIEKDKTQKNYVFMLDVDDIFSVAFNVIDQFSREFKEKENYKLNVVIDSKYYEQYKMLIDNITNSFKEIYNQRHALCQLEFMYSEDINLDELFSKMDFYITNRKSDTVKLSCIADNNNVEIISGVDKPIF